MNEKLIEKKLVKAVSSMGGLALKFFSVWFTGVPDRIVLMPDGRIYFVELKTTGKELQPRQVIVIALLRRLGFKVYVIDDVCGLDNFLKEIQL